MGVDSGLYKVGGVRVYAPPLLTPKFSPAGPCATVPVLGRSFPKESYPSLANQPSSGAKQGDMSSKSGGVEQCPPPRRGKARAPWQPPWPPRTAIASGIPRLLAGPSL